MDEQLKSSENISNQPQSGPSNTAAVLKDIQQRLVFLERKIDTLLNQSSERPSFQKRDFPRPQRPFGRFNRHGRGQHENGPREGNFSQPQQPRHFDKPREDGGQGFGPKKKRFFHRGHGKFNKRPSH